MLWWKEDQEWLQELDIYTLGSTLLHRMVVMIATALETNGRHILSDEQ